MINLFFSPNPEIYKKWKEKIDKMYKPDLFTNPKNLSEQDHKNQIINGYYIQELTGNWFKDNLPDIPVTINLSIGKDKYDTDKYDILIGDCFTIDVKTSKAIRNDYKKTDAVVVVKRTIDGYKIQGYWITKELNRFDSSGVYLIPKERLKPIKSLIMKLKKWK